MSVWSNLKGGPLVRWGAAALTALTLAACGGDQVDPFQPSRLVVFGDEASVLSADGRKYGVNPVAPQDCRSSPSWVQFLAGEFGFVFAECNPNNVASPNAFMRAQFGARAADLASQIDGFLTAGNSFGRSTLVTVFVGANDILFQSQQALTEAQMIANVQEAGRTVAAQVNRLAAADARVLVLTIPNQGYTPYGRADTSGARSTLLRKLTEAFNLAMRNSNQGGIINDGRRIALVDAWEVVRLHTEYPEDFAPRMTNVTQPMCTDATVGLGCTTSTLVAGANGTTWLWANQTQMGPVGQVRLGELAEERTRNNPF